MMQVQITTRIPAPVAEILAEIAHREKRSMSAQLALIVEQWIATQTIEEIKKAA
jgi:hypothetical protein